MEKLMVLFISLVFASVMTACESLREAPNEENIPQTPSEMSDNFSEIATVEKKEENTVNQIKITAGDNTFTATLYDNAAAEAFAKMLPLTLDMSELNGNEKYFYLSEDLPASPERPEKIHTGDIMLYGTGCVVLFYDTFSTSYSYTRLGHIEDTAGLSKALGKGGVEVKFEKIL